MLGNPHAEMHLTRGVLVAKERLQSSVIVAILGRHHSLLN